VCRNVVYRSRQNFTSYRAKCSVQRSRAFYFMSRYISVVTWVFMLAMMLAMLVERCRLNSSLVSKGCTLIFVQFPQARRYSQFVMMSVEDTSYQTRPKIDAGDASRLDWAAYDVCLQRSVEKKSKEDRSADRAWVLYSLAATVTR